VTGPPVDAPEASGTRFGFGANWAQFLKHLDEDRIAEAEQSLEAMLGHGYVKGRTFLDIGCGSGLFSLAAHRLGARRVRSFDFDPDSVACADHLRQRFTSKADNWEVSRGDALDPQFLESLGAWDIVYSWGVLHHTGDMWQALANAGERVADDGRLFISIYNDQGRRSAIWKVIKHTYNRLPHSLRTGYVAAVMLPREILSFAANTARGRPLDYLRSWTGYRQNRGMSRWHDMVDWVGGYPFEVATPEEVFAFFRDRGFTLEQLVTCAGGLGCNQFVLERRAPAVSLR
jgi:2-polyprenyl-6-hydroxyphenyl methylase/3-demethylubiquinone-9 3-methyltransferase